MRSRAIIVGAVFSLFALLSPSIGHVDAAKSKPKSGPSSGYPTYHVNNIYVGITNAKVVTLPSDSSDAPTHRYLVLSLSVRNGNDVIIKADPSWFTLTDALDQPASVVDECSQYLSNQSSETTRLASAFQPRLCSQQFITSNSDLINPGQVARGTIAFTVPSGQHRATFSWAPQGAMAYGITWPTKTWTIHY